MEQSPLLLSHPTTCCHQTDAQPVACAVKEWQSSLQSPPKAPRQLPFPGLLISRRSGTLLDGVQLAWRPCCCHMMWQKSVLLSNLQLARAFHAGCGHRRCPSGQYVTPALASDAYIQHSNQNQKGNLHFLSLGLITLQHDCSVTEALKQAGMSWSSSKAACCYMTPARPAKMRVSFNLWYIAQPSPAQLSPAQPSTAQPSPTQPSPAQPSPAQPSPAQPSRTQINMSCMI